MRFHCKACKDYRDKEHPNYPDFEHAGYDENVIQWSDESHSKPRVDEKGFWPRSINKPKPGETRAVHIGAPFSEPEGEGFWCLYMPAASFFNGWEDHPEEIEKSAFLKCRVLKAIEKTEHAAWAIVCVDEVVGLETALHVFSSKEASSKFLSSLWEIEPGSFHSFGDWVYFHCFDGGSNGYSLLFKIDENGICHLLYYSETAPHCSASYLGNLVVNRELIDKLAARDNVNA